MKFQEIDPGSMSGFATGLAIKITSGARTSKVEFTASAMQLFPNGVSFAADMTAGTGCFFRKEKNNHYSFPEGRSYFNNKNLVKWLADLQVVDGIYTLVPLETEALGTVYVITPQNVAATQDASVESTTETTLPETSGTPTEEAAAAPHSTTTA